MVNLHAVSTIPSMNVLCTTTTSYKDNGPVCLSLPIVGLPRLTLWCQYSACVWTLAGYVAAVQIDYHSCYIITKDIVQGLCYYFNVSPGGARSVKCMQTDQPKVSEVIGS